MGAKLPKGVLDTYTCKGCGFRTLDGRKFVRHAWRCEEVEDGSVPPYEYAQ